MVVDSFRAPGNGRGRGGFRLTGGLAKPNAVLEQIWNIAEIGVGCFTCFGTLPSVELFQRIRRKQPLKHDLMPNIILLSNNSGPSGQNNEASRYSLHQSLRKIRQSDKGTRSRCIMNAAQALVRPPMHTFRLFREIIEHVSAPTQLHPDSLRLQ